MVCTAHEVDVITPVVTAACDSVCTDAWVNSNYAMPYVQCSVGCMLEVPRACVLANRIATTKYVDFLSIGTDQLTQLCFGMSPYDAHSFMVTIVIC